MVRWVHGCLAWCDGYMAELGTIFETPTKTARGKRFDKEATLPRQPKQLELPYSVERDFIGHLKDDLTFWRSEYKFLQGKVERLELAMATFSNAPAKAYVDRTDTRPPIEAVKVETEPVKKSWKQTQAEWAAMTDEQKQAALEGKGAN